MMGVRTIIIWCCAVASCVADGTWTHCPEPTPGEAILVPFKKLDVTQLHLIECNITYIVPSSFDNVPNLRVLILEKNIIKYFDPNAFKHTKYLTEIYFSNNSIRDKAEIKLPSLETVKIIHNDMSRVDFALGGGLTTLEMVHCALETVPTVISSFHPNLLKLVLSHNCIRSLDYDTLSYVDQLQVLDLGYNNISDIHENSFDQIAKVETIILKNNLIKRIPERLFQNKMNLMSVNLKNNLIEYIPSNLFKGSSPSKIDLSYNMLIYLPDNFLPANYIMSDKTRDFDFYIDHNPWQCACLNEILIQLKRKFVNYIPGDENEFRGNEPTCVMTNFQCFKPEKHLKFYKMIKKGR